MINYLIVGIFTERMNPEEIIEIDADIFGISWKCFQYFVQTDVLEDDFFPDIIYNSLYLLDAYTSGQLVYEWQEGPVNFMAGMALSQFDLMSSPYRNLTFFRREGEFSVLQVSFNLQRHTGYFLIQVSAHKL